MSTELVDRRLSPLYPTQTRSATPFGQQRRSQTAAGVVCTTPQPAQVRPLHDLILLKTVLLRMFVHPPSAVNALAFLLVFKIKEAPKQGCPDREP